MFTFNFGDVEREAEEFKKVISGEECNRSASPIVRKRLPQTSNLVTVGKVLGKQKNYEESEIGSLFNFETDINILSLPDGVKLIATPILKALFKEIIAMHPHIKYTKDTYESKSEIFKYCFTDSYKKIRKATDLPPSTKSIIFSQRSKIPLQKPPHSLSNLSTPKNSYQIIDFNKSIPKPDLLKTSPRSKDLKVLKTHEKISDPIMQFTLRQTKSSSDLNSQSLLPVHIQNRTTRLLLKYKNPFPGQKKTKNRFHSEPVPQEKPLKIPPKLYYELMQVPHEFQRLLSYSKYIQMKNLSSIQESENSITV